MRGICNALMVLAAAVLGVVMGDIAGHMIGMIDGRLAMAQSAVCEFTGGILGLLAGVITVRWVRRRND